jgi:hypothetical protein
MTQTEFTVAVAGEDPCSGYRALNPGTNGLSHAYVLLKAEIQYCLLTAVHSQLY